MNINLISISGIDGSGKSTQFELLKKHFEISGFKIFYLWTRGGSTPGINTLKSFLRLLAGKKLPPSGKSKQRDKIFKNLFIQRLWVTAAILDLMYIYIFLIRWKLIRGYKVICDRYLWDTLIDFQIMFPELKIEKWFIWQLLSWFSPVPVKQVLLVIPLEVSIRRCEQKYDPFPDMPEIRKKRHDLYIHAAKDGKFFVIDAEQNSEDVLKEIIR